MNIQMDKYLEITGKEAFDSDEEARLIIGKIISEWNAKVAPDKLRLDNLNDTAKAEWFYSITPDYSEELEIIAANEEDFDEDFYEDYQEDFDEDEEENPDPIFPFLPEGASLFLMFAGPALEEFGYPAERFFEISHGEEPTEIEIDLLYWAMELTRCVSEAYFIKNKEEKEMLLEEAEAIASEKIDFEAAQKVIKEISYDMKEFFAKENKKGKAKKKRKKKKK